MCNLYIIGQRTFSAATSQNVDVHAKVVKVATVDVKPNSSSSVGITDSEPNAFLMIVSEVKPPAAPTPTPTTPAHPGVPHATPPAKPPESSQAEVQKPTSSTKTPLVYIQRDEADTSGTADKIYKALVPLQAKEHGVKVAKGVQKIKGAQMPTYAQVRYFNDADKAIASASLEALKQTFPDARLVRMAIPAPAGQYEVWLPRKA